MPPALSDHLDGSSKAAQDMLQVAVEPFFLVFHGHCKDIELKHLNASEEEVDGTLLVVGCDPQYNIDNEKERATQTMNASARTTWTVTWPA